MQALYSLETEKEAHHFSCCHMATFADGSIERLHGHNYRVETRLAGKLDIAGMVLDVIIFKKIIRALCDEIDEYILLPIRNPLINVQHNAERVTVDYEGKHYEFPRADCQLLDIENTTMEHLAHWFAGRLADGLRGEPGYDRMQQLFVSVSETPGQKAGWTLDLHEYWNRTA